MYNVSLRRLANYKLYILNYTLKRLLMSLHLIIYAAGLLVLALAAPLFSPFFRKVREEETTADDASNPAVLPPVSVVLTAHDSSYHLAKVLPKLLEQQYPGDFQVIVVIDKSDSESEDVLKRQGENQHLYYTMLPETSRYLSRKKLGITLGIRAAKHDWVLVTDVHSVPSSENWLANMARHCSGEANMVLGLSLYGDDTPAYFRYEQLRTMLYYLRMAQQDTAFCTNQSVVMLRKSEFFAENGFRGNLEFARAEFEFLVNKFAGKGTCALAIEPEARMTAMKPSDKRWRMRQLFAIDAFRSLRRSFRFRMLFRTDLAVMHAFNLLTLVTVVMAAFMFPASDGMVLMASAVLSWIISNVERYIIYRPVLRYYRCVSPAMAIMTDWTISLRKMILRVRYAFSDKNDFITHKL